MKDLTSDSFINLWNEQVDAIGFDPEMQEMWNNYFRGPDIAKALGSDEKDIICISSENDGGAKFIEYVLVHGELKRVTEGLYDLHIYHMARPSALQNMVFVWNCLDGIPAVHTDKSNLDEILKNLGDKEEPPEKYKEFCDRLCDLLTETGYLTVKDGIATVWLDEGDTYIDLTCPVLHQQDKTTEDPRLPVNSISTDYSA